MYDLSGGFDRVTTRTRSRLCWLMLIPSLILVLAAASVLLSYRTAVRETSLISCWAWCLVACAGLVAGSWLASDDAIGSPVQFAADTVVLCPMISLFGARRPQDRGWNFIVLTLWCVMALPAAEAVFVLRQPTVELHPARTVFMSILIGASWLNHVVTRFAVPACWMALGQLFVLSQFLLGRTVGPYDRMVGIVLLAMAVLWAHVLGQDESRAPVAPGWNRVWIDFRDLFGALWALRLQERVNSTAEQNRWPIRIEWSGVEGLDQVSEAQREAIENCFGSYLRRFVSDPWIARRRT